MFQKKTFGDLQNTESDAPMVNCAVLGSSLLLSTSQSNLHKVWPVCGLRQLQALEGGNQEAWSLRQIILTNERPVSKSHDRY